MMKEPTKSDGNGSGDFPPELVHRILLTDASQLTTGNHQSLQIPTFEDFCNELDSSFDDESIENTVKRAYRDQLLQQVQESGEIKPLRDLLLELHAAARSLVPNRPDLHSVLKDEDVTRASTPMDLLPHIIIAGHALSQLESEARAESTLAWLEQARSKSVEEMDLKQSVEFLVTSILYLLLKVELCQHDKQQFFLSTVWAPQIYNQGPELERQAFQARYGTFKDQNTAPLTRKWISSLVMQSNRKELVDSASAREAMVKEGWITDILFRGPERPPLSMPEILVLDLEQLNNIRTVTRSAAAGSALALHACNAAGVSTAVLNEPVDATSSIELRRQGVVEATSSPHLYRSREEYEENVAKAVVRLAKEWNPSLSSNAQAQLESRTTSVLRAEDPVIRLLDSRMKEVFSMLMEWKPTSATVEMKSGLAAQDSSPRALDTSARAFLASAKSAFCQKGLSFYASDLAGVSYLAKKVADLAWKVYGEPLLDKMILDACKAASIDPE